MLDLTQVFEATGGSVIGRNHVGYGNVLTGKNNQDAALCLLFPDCLLAVVCDGCGSSPVSEVGANLLAKFVARHARFGAPLLGDDPTPDRIERFLERVRLKTLHELSSLAGSCRLSGIDAVEFVRDQLLATIVFAVITTRYTFIASIGDGVFAINGNLENIGPYNNVPPYIAYALLDRQQAMPEESFRFSLHALLPTEHLQSLMIGCDGVLDLVSAADKLIPGKNLLVGSINQFWEDDQYFDNPVALERKLHRLNSEVHKINREKMALDTFTGLLPDDTTLVIFRRKKC